MARSNSTAIGLGTETDGSIASRRRSVHYLASDSDFGPIARTVTDTAVILTIMTGQVPLHNFNTAAPGTCLTTPRHSSQRCLSRNSKSPISISLPPSMNPSQSSRNWAPRNMIIRSTVESHLRFTDSRKARGIIEI